jgi:hypothetical protein
MKTMRTDNSIKIKVKIRKKDETTKKNLVNQLRNNTTKEK